MKTFLINDLISDKISGEWGIDPVSDKCVKVIRSTNFTNEGKLKLSNVVEREISDAKVQQKMLKLGDIIIEKSGGSPSQPVGRVVFFDVSDGNTYLCNNFTSILRPAKNVFPKYLFYNLYYLHLKNKTLNYQNKTTGIINLQLDRYIKTERVPLPILEDQKRIVKILDQADALRQKRKQAIGLLDDYLKSVFLEMFGDPVRNPKKWKEPKLGTLLKSMTSGSRGWAKYYSDDGDIFFTIKNVGRKNQLILKDITYVNPPNTAESKRTKVQGGDVLLSITADLGRTAVVPKLNRDAYINQHLAILRLKKGNPTYISHYISSNGGQLQINSMNKGAAKAGLNFNDVKSINIQFPPMELQNRFSYIVQKTESIKQIMLAQSEKLETQFQALMQKAFEGKE